MRRESVGIFTLTIVFTILFVVSYAYFVGAPIQRLSRQIAIDICKRMGPKCDPSTLR